MSRNLPPDFLRERKPILGAEWEDFLQSYDTPRAYGSGVIHFKAVIRFPSH